MSDKIQAKTMGQILEDWKRATMAGHSNAVTNPTNRLPVETLDILVIPVKIKADPLMPKTVAMFGGFSYDNEDEDDDDVGGRETVDVKKLQAQIEEQKKTIDRLSNLHAVHPENTIFVLKVPTGAGWSQEDHNDLVKMLPKGSLVIAMPEDYKLEGLTEQDLADVGLQRSGPALTEQQAYDLMLLGHKL